MQLGMKTPVLGIVLAGAVMALPAHVAAQQPEQQQEQAVCVATVMPAQLAPGEEATEVTITVSEPIGEVVAVEAGESAITLAEVTALPRTPLAGPDETPTAIRMGDAENQWIVYLNTADAQAGSYELTFRSEEGTCTGEITLGDPAR